MAKKISLLIIFFLIILMNGCNNQEKPKVFDYGRVENNKYANSFFDFEMTLPIGWVVQTKEQMDNMLDKGKDLVAGDDSKMKEVLKASDINTATLLSVFQYQPGSAVDYNPNFTLVAENIKNFPGIKTGSDYLFQSRKILEQSQLKFDYIDKEFSKEVINGTAFYKMNAEIKYMGVNIKQIYYSTITKGFSFNTIISFISDEQKQELMKSINSMKFK